MEEVVVLVNEKNEPVGTIPKLEAHGPNTPLHRGFSVFLFNSRGELLLQQRSRTKKTWPLVWSNSVCGHPRPDESSVDATRRRLKYELGIEQVEVFEILPDYRYRAEKDGIVENELCPVLVAFSNQSPTPRPGEVEAIRWIPWQNFVEEIKSHPENYSPWCVEETLLLEQNKLFQNLFTKHCFDQMLR